MVSISVLEKIVVNVMSPETLKDDPDPDPDQDQDQDQDQDHCDRIYIEKIVIGRLRKT